MFNHPCPNCGHCPTCGRGGYTIYPPYPYWGYQYIHNGTTTTNISELGEQNKQILAGIMADLAKQGESK